MVLSLLKRSVALGKLVRYSAVSVIATSTSLVTLGLLVGVFGVGATLANLCATACGTIPSFELNRRWVWAQKGKGAFWGQFVPFCGLTLAGLVLSTITVHAAASRTMAWGRFSHTAAVELANVAAYGTVWIIQFFVLDRLLFASRPRATHDIDDSSAVTWTEPSEPALERSGDRSLVAAAASSTGSITSSYGAAR